MRKLAAAVGFAAALILAACGPQGPKFTATDVSGASFARDFSLVDAAGKTRTLGDFHGKAVVVFFGFTQCPDVCPTTLSTLAEAMRMLGTDADRVQVVFITVDPERDTSELLAQYVPAFDPRFIGLRGDADATARTAKEFKIVYQKVPGRTPETYSVDHSAGLYIFDPNGRLRLFASHGQKADAIAHDLRELLRSAG
jgi:protein SCO1/2